MNEIRSPSLARYREFVPDWPGFQAAISTPEPVGVRVRLGLTTPEELLRHLGAQGFALEPVPGLASQYRLVAGPRSIAQTIEHWLGLFHIQQTVMTLPVLALAPTPGERVLDLCAAPGGKTTHLAQLMEDRGSLVAVDPKEKRLRGLLANVFRLGHTNVLVVAMDGRAVPGTALFDRVLVDAPCSAEGTIRRKGRSETPRSPNFVSYVTSLQEALLRRAIDLTRPGGTIVYSTCTFAPEENEGVVSRAMEGAPVQVEPISLRLPHSPGLDRWRDQTYHPDLRHAWRVYPHQLDSGGLFMVKLRRSGLGSEGQPADGWSRVPEIFGDDPASYDNTFRYSSGTELEHWFANSDELAGVQWMVRGDSVWAHTLGSWPVPSWPRSGRGGGWRVVSLGIRALRKGAGGAPTPSNHFLTRWGRHLAPTRRIQLDRIQLRTLLDGRPVAVPGRSPGPYALEWEHMVLGRGILGGRGLVHEIPKALAARLADVVAAVGSPPDRRT